MRKERKMTILKDGSTTFKDLNHGKRGVAFKKQYQADFEHWPWKAEAFVLLFRGRNGQITFLQKFKSEDEAFSNVIHVNKSWRRLKKDFILEKERQNWERI